MLIERGADLRLECEHATPLLWAVRVRCFPVVERILGVHADLVAAQVISRQDVMLHYAGTRSDWSPGGGTALHTAAYLHPVAISVSKILTAHPGAGPANRRMHERGVGWGDKHRLDESEQEGLSDSLLDLDLSGHLRRHLVDAGASAVDTTTYRRSQLQQALSEWNSRFTAALLAAGLSATTTDLDGQTPLHIAAYSGDVESCRLLLAAGADVGARTREGATPLLLALRGGHSRVVELLKLAGGGHDDQEVTGGMAEEAWRRVIERGEREPFTRRGRVLGKVGGARGDGARMCDGRVPPAGSEGARDGGWRRGCEEELEIEEGMCDIASVRVEDAAFNETLRRHVEAERPLRIRGVFQALEGKIGARAQDAWSKQALVNASGRYGAFKVFRQKDGRKQTLSLSLAEYLAWMAAHDAHVDHQPDWLVDFSLEQEHDLVQGHAHALVEVLGEHYAARLRGPLGLSNYQFMIGPVLTGASPHFHYASFRSMVFGRARWFLWPPAQAFYSTRDIYDWFLTEYPALVGAERPLECVQGPGDVMFVPSLWGHGVLYLEDTIGMASLFRS